MTRLFRDSLILILKRNTVKKLWLVGGLQILIQVSHLINNVPSACALPVKPVYLKRC